MRQAWKANFPDIALNFTVDLSKYHDTRVDRAYLFDNGSSVADVVLLQVLSDFPKCKAQGRLLQYKPPSYDDLLEEWKDQDGAYLPAYLLGFGPFYFDSSKCPASTIPDSYKSLVDPQWRGKLTLTYPNDDDAENYLFSIIVSHYSFDWFNKLAANDVRWVRGSGTPILEFLANHNDTNNSRCLSFSQIGYFNTANTSFIESKIPSYPEQTMSWVQQGAILANTPHPNMAKLFMAFLTSSIYQNATAGCDLPIGARGSVTGASVLQSVNAEKAVSPYNSNVTQVTGYPIFEADRALVEWWKNQFESIIGTAQGPGPMEVYPNPPCCA